MTPKSCYICDKKRPGLKANSGYLDCHGRPITPGRRNCGETIVGKLVKKTWVKLEKMGVELL